MKNHLIYCFIVTFLYSCCPKNEPVAISCRSNYTDIGGKCGCADNRIDHGNGCIDKQYGYSYYQTTNGCGGVLDTFIATIKPNQDTANHLCSFVITSSKSNTLVSVGGQYYTKVQGDSISSMDIIAFYGSSRPKNLDIEGKFSKDKRFLYAKMTWRYATPPNQYEVAEVCNTTFINK
jgi:hypothetical protein